MTAFSKEGRLKVYQDSNISSFVRALGVISSFVLIKSADRYLSDDELGYLLTAFSLFSFLALFDLGLGNASRNLISSEYFSRKKYGAFEVYVVLNTLLVGIVFIVGAQIFLMTYKEGWLGNILNGENIFYIIISVLCQPGRIGCLSISKTYIAQIIQYSPLITVTLYSLLIAADLESMCRFYLRLQCLFNLLGFLFILRHIDFVFGLIVSIKLISAKILSKAFSYLLIQSLATTAFLLLNLWVIESVSINEGLSFNLMFRIYSAGLAVFGAYILPKWTQITVSDLSLKDLIRSYIGNQINIIYVFIFGGLIIGLFGNQILALLINEFKPINSINWALIFIYYCFQIIVQVIGVLLNGLGMTRIQVIFGVFQLVFFTTFMFISPTINLYQSLLGLLLFSSIPLVGSILYLYRQYVRDSYTHI